MVIKLNFINIMSYHIKLEYVCPNCKAEYIPYEEGLPCPSCKIIPTNTPKEYLGFIDELIVSLRINKMSCDRYIPDAWLTASFTDNLQSVFFRLFQFLSIKKPRDGEAFINEYFKNFIIKDKEVEFMRNYLHIIALKVHSRKEEFYVSSWSRLWSKFLRNLLP
jgi:hypothetical protein